MYSILLPLIAAMSVAPQTGTPSDPLPTAYRPCEGSVPVFNPQGCPAADLAIDEREPRGEAPCADRIRQVRAASGQPRLEHVPAAPGRAYMIAAVDKRINGCAVMQMYGDAADVRPLPATSEGPLFRPLQ